MSSALRPPAVPPADTGGVVSAAAVSPAGSCSSCPFLPDSASRGRQPGGVSGEGKGFLPLGGHVWKTMG